MWTAVRNDPQGPAGDCWTHAWNYANQHGLDYCEGVAVNHQGSVAVHAWCLDWSGLLTPNGVVVDVTSGYENARRYVGFIIDRENAQVQVADRIMREDGAGERSSVLETMLGSGMPFGQIVALGVVR